MGVGISLNFCLRRPPGPYTKKISLLSDHFFNMLHAYFQRLTVSYYPMTRGVWGKNGQKWAEKRWERKAYFDGKVGNFEKG
jgi:hypothetical protein